MFRSEKKAECERLIRLIADQLPSTLESKGFSLDRSNPIDFQTVLKYIGSKENRTQIATLFNTDFPLVKPGKRKNEHGHGIPNNKISDCLQIRNCIAHNKPCTEDELENGICVLKECCKVFGLRSDVVPLRILACNSCKTVITRTAQPSFETEGHSGTIIKLCRTYDVQVYSVGNVPGERAMRDDEWYAGWVWTKTYCGTCKQWIGYRFDWAPEDRVDLDTSSIVYSKEKQAMVVVYTDGTERDLTHVVSDGEVRRHRYGFLDSKLEQV